MSDCGMLDAQPCVSSVQLKRATEVESVVPNVSRITVCATNAFRWFLGTVIVLIVIGTAANIAGYHGVAGANQGTPHLLHRFDLAHEPSISNWYSSAAILLCAALLGVIALISTRRKTRHAWRWWGLAAVFLALSIEEGVALHELIQYAVTARFPIHCDLYVARLITTVSIAIGVAVLYVPFLFHIDRRTAWRFSLMGALYVFGAVGMEVVGNEIAQHFGKDVLWYALAQSFEEFFEMLSIVGILWTLLDYLRRIIGPLSFEIV